MKTWRKLLNKDKEMKIKFKDVSSGIVEARGIWEIQDGIFINEITVLKKGHDVSIELPQKNFKGKDGRFHYLNIINFEDENKEIIFKLEVKEAYLEWRKKNKKVLVYSDND